MTATRARTALIAAILAAAPAGAALAHDGGELTDHNVWQAWDFTLDAGLPILLVVAIYINGAIRRQSSSRPHASVRHALFLAGMFALYLSLQSPIDPLGERLFMAHQVQHFLIRMVAPMLIVLGHAQGMFIAGLPAPLRKYVAAPLMSNGALSWLYTFLTRPLVAFVVFLLSLYAWEIPSLHNLALLNAPLHWTMHITMMLAGLIFFTMIFAQHDRPSAASHRMRILLLFASIVSNILLGALTTFKSAVLYTAYDVEGRLFGFTPISDETIGGIIIWVPASMMTIIAIILVIFDWNAIEKKRLKRQYAPSGDAHAPLSAPITAAEGRARAAEANRRVGLTLALAAMIMFTMILGTAVTVVSLG